MHSFTPEDAVVGVSIPAFRPLSPSRNSRNRFPKRLPTHSTVPSSVGPLPSPVDRSSTRIKLSPASAGRFPAPSRKLSPASAGRFPALPPRLLPRTVAALALGTLVGCGGVDPDVPEGNQLPPPVEWQVVFEDEFDGSALDASKWNIQTGDGCPDLCGWGNNELQIYSADNISVADGMLSLTGRQEADGSYTSARVNTNGKFDFTYGRVEVRARIPSGRGTWPAIWMLHSNPDNYGWWPHGGEIDIMEAFNYGVDGNDRTASTTHYGLPIAPFHGASSSTDLAASADVNFHVYALEWEQDRLRFYVDGTHFQTQTSDEWYAYYPACDPRDPACERLDPDDPESGGKYDSLGAHTLGPEGAPFDHPFHLLLNFAIGGNPVGSPDANTVFPQSFMIDYVRVYECANGNPDTGRGCGTANPAVEPLEDHDGGPLEDRPTARPYVSSTDLYVDGPETITIEFGEEQASNTLSVDGYIGDGAMVTNDPAAQDPDDPGNTVWHIAVSGGVANAYLTSQVFEDDPILETGFDLSGDAVGEVVFDMRVNSVDPGATLVVKLDSGWPNLGAVALPHAKLRVGGWKTYAVRLADFLANPGGGGTGVELANVLNPFVFEVVGGSADVYLDNIRISNACYEVGGCAAGLRTKGAPDLVVFDDEVNLGVWDVGIAGADDGSGFANYSDGTDPANKANWRIIDDDDPDRGKVIEVTFNDSSAFGVWFIQSSIGVNLEAYAAGAVEFDIFVDDYGSNDTGITFKIDCIFPCSSNDKSLGVIADGEWQTVSYPVSSLTGSGLDLGMVNTGIVVFPTAPQSGTIRFRLDNIRWAGESAAPPLAPLDLPVTFDDPAVDYSLLDFNGPITILTDDPEGGDNRVAQTTHHGDAYGGTVIGPGAGFANPIPFTESATSLSLRVYSPAAGIPVMLKVEDAENPAVFAESVAMTTTANAWETLVYNYAGGISPATITYEKAVVFFNFGNPGDGGVYYWDDVRFGGGGEPPPPSSGLDLPVGFDDSGVEYALTDFGGAMTMLVTDPEDGSNMVASTLKPTGAQTWAGTTVGTNDGLASAVPFASGRTTMTVRVYSPDAGVPVRLKAEDAADATVSVETEATTTVANAWETLTFDFSNPADGTAALDLARRYDKVSIFFNFGTTGNDAGEKTYLWDDVRFVTTPTSMAQWQIVFQDEFDGGSLDASKWNVQTGDGCPDLCGWGNNELQRYTADNISVSDGVLNIIGRLEADSSHTSARIDTKGKFDFERGRVEVRARIPSGQGTWPALSMLSSRPDIYGPWPHSGQVVIMEAINYGVGDNRAVVSGTVYGLPIEPFHGASATTDLATSADINFHVYALEWERDQLRFFVDGTHHQTQTSDNWYAYYPADGDGAYDPLGAYTPGPDAAPFDQPFHLLLNFAIGGDVVGAPATATVFPQSFAIDYVRVYECAHGDPATSEGCGAANPAVSPLEDGDGGPLEGVSTARPYVASTDLYVNGPETITFTVDGTQATNTLVVDGFTGSSATVTNNPTAQDPDDPANMAWHVAISNDVANVYLTSQDLTDDPTLDTGFDLSGASVGELVFDMRVNSVDPAATLLVKLDSGWPNLSEVALPHAELRTGGWKTYSVKFTDLVANPAGTGVDLANVLNPFVFEVSGGSADVHLDNIRISRACHLVGSCDVMPRTKGTPPPPTSRVALPITFEDGDAEYYGFLDFGGTAGTMLIEDLVDSGNTVASTLKQTGAQTWAGTIVGGDAGLASAVPFAAGRTAMTVRVYSPDAGIQVRLKVEDAADATISVETEATTTVANAWETLTFDFSNPAEGTAALDLARRYDKVVIFFDFGATGGDKTYLWDDIRFGSATSGE